MVPNQVIDLNLHGDVVDVALNVQSDLDRLTASDTLDPSGGVGLVDTCSRDVITLRARRRAKGTAAERLRGVVVDDGTGGAGSTSEGGIGSGTKVDPEQLGGGDPPITTGDANPTGTYSPGGSED